MAAVRREGPATRLLRARPPLPSLAIVYAMRSQLSSGVHAANALTARWCDGFGAGDFVFSGPGLWPLLALLASAASEPARSELAAAIGRPAGYAQREALEL